MLTPGVVPAANSNALPRFNRSHEYDAVNDLYARFLLEEILPEVSKKLNLSTNPDDRGLCRRKFRRHRLVYGGVGAA